MRKLFQIDLHFDRDTVVITIISTLLLMVDHYHRFTGYKYLDRALLYLVAPLAIIIFVFRKNPKEFGFQLGDWKAGLAITGLAVLIIAPILWLVASGDEGMQGYYSNRLNAMTPVVAFFDLVGWEFFFRGWILFGYARSFGDNALWLQAVPFALAHIGKPELETMSTIFGGFLFGLIAWRTRSFIYPFLIHWFVYTFTIMVAGGAFS
ncbi:MAG: CPBP family intramembrane metalloprotease [Chloroflexi bacterium]|nr:CPBP family intramembrane metalloprotease [Chloroflexota bacterium]